MAGTYETFAALHVPGDPVILYNIWDVGSALAVVAAGAKALATGSHPVADANGWPDGQKVPMDFAFANARRDRRRRRSAAHGRFRRRLFGRPSRRRRERRSARGNRRGRLQFRGPGDRRRRAPSARPAGEAHRRDPPSGRRAFFINARTDLFLKTQTYDDALIDQVVERGKAFADAGASGFFVPRLADPTQIERVVREVPLPLNVIAFPGAPDKKVWADAGVARISHGPFPHRALMATLTEMAQRRR